MFLHKGVIDCAALSDSHSLLYSLNTTRKTKMSEKQNQCDQKGKLGTIRSAASVFNKSSQSHELHQGKKCLTGGNTGFN